ncbi:uncharacterized protein [Drosophila kikkawai]|uniref:Uncharacterized protein n=1 Tax=Drosophila kikkawai TaxID=30033 RepID=A0ABM4GB40_DROKI
MLWLGFHLFIANGLERGSSFLTTLLPPFPVWHRVHLGVLTPGSPHLKQKTFNTSDSHALNACPTVPQFQQVHFRLRLVLDKAHLPSDDPYIPGELRSCLAVWSIELPGFFPRRGIRVGVDPDQNRKTASLVAIGERAWSGCILLWFLLASASVLLARTLARNWIGDSGTAAVVHISGLPSTAPDTIAGDARGGK